mgnify:CR=1 FL=1
MPLRQVTCVKIWWQTSQVYVFSGFCPFFVGEFIEHFFIGDIDGLLLKQVRTRGLLKGVTSSRSSRFLTPRVYLHARILTSFDCRET